MLVTVYRLAIRPGLAMLSLCLMVAGTEAATVVRTMNFGSTFHDFDVASGTATAIPKVPIVNKFASTLDRRSDGAIFGLQGRDLIQFSFSPAGSSWTDISTLSQSIEAISFGSGDQLFGVDTSSNFYQIDAASGSVSNAVSITYNGSAISGVTGLDIAEDGTHYLVDSTHLYTFDAATGVANRAPNRGVNGVIFTDLSVGPGNVMFATVFNTTTPLAQIDPTTGSATLLGSNPTGSPYSALVIVAVPEPSFAMFGGLLTAAVCLRRGRREPAAARC